VASVRGKVDLLRGLLSGGAACTGPFYVFIDLTRRCNLRCLGCPYHSPYTRRRPAYDQSIQDLPLGLLAGLLDDLSAMNTPEIMFVGEGENLLYPRLFEAISMAKERGLRVGLLTNGTLIDDASIRSLVESRLDLLKVSLWAGTTEDYLVNYPGIDPSNFGRVVEGLRMLSSRKRELGSRYPRVVMHHPINRTNFQRLDGMVELARATDCDGITFAPLQPVGGSLDSFVLSVEEEGLVRDNLTRIAKLLNSLTMEHNIDTVLLRYDHGTHGWRKMPCYIGWLHARIKVDGSVLPCNEGSSMAIGDLKEHSFREIWHSRAYGDFRRRMLTGRGKAAMGDYADCSYCCHAMNNARVNRWFKWLYPLATRPSTAWRPGMEGSAR
jgi:MoaA/NifB/PqqE/SkfB family radical SAM enzyme